MSCMKNILSGTITSLLFFPTQYKKKGESTDPSYPYFLFGGVGFFIIYAQNSEIGRFLQHEYWPHFFVGSNLLRRKNT